jgi:hypothetical protein
MDNRDNKDLTARLNAILASAYSGGNSYAARKARAEIQNRDDEGKFAFMFGLMRLVMLQNGIPVATFSRFVGGSDGGENMGWFHVNSENGSIPAGFYRYPVNLASDMGTKSSSVQAVLPGDYLASKGIDLKNPSSFGNFPNIEDLEFQEIPPDFMEHPDIDGAFISEDGDVTIEPNEFGGYDVVDNIDPENTVQSVDDLGEAMKAVHAIDMTRKDYVPTEFDRETMTDAQLVRARDLANKAPVATLPTETTPEAPKADPAGMTNADLTAEGQKLFGADGRPFPLADKERASQILDEQDARAELEPDGYEGNWFTDNPDFIRDPSKSEAPVAEIPAVETPVAEIPSADAISPDQSADLERFKTKLEGMSNGEVRDTSYEDSDESDRMEAAGFSPSAYEKAYTDLIGAEYTKRFKKMQEESPDSNNYFNPVYTDIASGTHAYDNNTNFFYEEDANGNISYGMRNYSPDSGLDNEEVYEAKTIEDARNKVIAMIDDFGKEDEIGFPDLPTDDGTFDQYGEIVERSDLDAYPVDSTFYVNKTLANGMLVQKSIIKVDDGNGLSHWEDERGVRLLTPKDFDEYFPSKTPAPVADRPTPVRQIGENYRIKQPELFLPGTAPAASKTPASKKLEDYTDEEIAVLAEQEQRADTPRTDGMIGFRPAPRTYRDEQIRRTVEALRYGEGQPDGGGVSSKPSTSTTPKNQGTPEQTKELLDLLRAKVLNENGELPAGYVRQDLYRAALQGDNVARYFSREEMEVALQELRVLPDGGGDGGKPPTPPVTPSPEEPEANVTSPEQLLEDVHMDRLDELLNYPDNVWENGNVQYSVQIFDALDGEDGGLKWSISFVDENGKEYYYAGVYDGGSIDGIRNEIQSQINQQKTPAEIVKEVPPAPEFRNLGQVINGTPNSAVLRRAKELIGVSENDLVGALAYILSNERNTAEINGKNYAPTVIIAALSSRGFDTDMFIAKKLDEKSGRTENVDALNAYRAENADVIGENGEQGDQDPVDMFLKNSSRDKLTSLYLDAIQNGRDSVAINLEDFGAPAALGPKMTEISVADFRKKLEDAGIDVDSLDNGFQDNEDAKQEIAEELGLPTDPADAPARTDWRQVIRRNDEEFRDVFYYDKNGDYHHLERRADGLWHRKNAPGGNGIGNEVLIRKMDRDADPNRNIEIDNGEPQDEESNYIDYEAKNIFRIGGPEGEFVEGAPSAPVIRQMMNVVGADASQIEAEEKAGRPVDIMDAVRKRFPNAKEGEDGELITEVHEWTGPDGTKYRYEVVVVRTADEYFYTYIRQTNLTENVAWSARLGVMSQSATAVFNAYNTNVGSFLVSFLRPGGPVKWMESDARKKSRRRDVWDEESKKWIHLKEIQNNSQTRANLKTLLGETPATNAQVRAAEDKFFEDILDGVTKWRMNDTKLQIFARNKGVTLDYLYRVIGAYDAHLANQANIEGYGTWVSYDQKTPLDAGDVIEHENGRRGVVRKRIGFVDSLGRYRYTDYVEVKWSNGDISWTTSRKNKLIRTVDGTDGSERINYKNLPTDPRAGEGVPVEQPDNMPVTQSDPLPANAPKQVRAVATRNENSELVLPDGTIVPELTIGGGANTHTAKRAENLQVGDFIGTLNSDMEYVSAPVLSAPVLSEDGSKYNVDVVVRESDGTYSVNTLSFPVSDRQQVLATTPVNNDTENSPTPAQLNELAELFGSKDLSGGDWTTLIDYYAGDSFSPVFTSVEIADIIQELRALPDRESTPVQDLADFARQASDDAARSGNQEAAQNFEALADAGDVIASQSPSAEAPTEATPEAPSVPETAEPAQPASPMDQAAFAEEVVSLRPTILEATEAISRDNAREWVNVGQSIETDGAADEFDAVWVNRYATRLFYRLDRLKTLYGYNSSVERLTDNLNAQSDSVFEEYKYDLQDTLRFLNTYAASISDRIMEAMMEDEKSRPMAEYLQKIKANPIQFTDERILSANTSFVDDSYSEGETERAKKAKSIKDAYDAGYEVVIPTTASDAPDSSLNQVLFVTLSDGTRAVLKYFTGAQVATDEVKNELAIARTFEELGVKNPAATVVVGPSGEEALLSEFIDDAKIAYMSVDFTDAADVMALENVGIIALMDLAMGNADRHEKNWFVNPDTEEIYPIDHGLLNETGIADKRDVAKWMEYIANAGAYYPGFHDVITEFLRGSRLELDSDLLTTVADRLSSLRKMYESMGMLDLYTQMLDTVNIMLGISRQ